MKIIKECVPGASSKSLRLCLGGNLKIDSEEKYEDMSH